MMDINRNIRSMLVLTGILAGCAVSGQVQAEQVYESVDAEGNVTFSDSPPASDAGKSRQIEVQPGLTDAQVQESQQQLQNLENQADEAVSAGQPQPSQPVQGYPPASAGSAEEETDVYVEGGYADERLREDAATDDRIRDERVNRVTPGQEGYREERYGEEGLREGAGGTVRPMPRVR